MRSLLIAFLFLSIIVDVKSQEEELILAYVRLDSLKGFIDTSGNWYISNKYDYLGPMSEGFAQAVLDETEGFIHLKTKTFIPFELWNRGKEIETVELHALYDYTYLLATKNGEDTIYIPSLIAENFDSDSVLFIDTIYKPNYTFIDDIAPVWVGSNYNCRYDYEYGKWGYVNRKGEWIVEPISDIGNYPSEGFLHIEKDNQLMYYNIKTKELTKLKYNTGFEFTEGLACVGKGDVPVEHDSNSSWLEKGKWGFVNTKFEEVIPLQYDMAFSFVNGLAQVYLNNKVAFINKQGKIVIPFIFDCALDFVDDYAVAMKDGMWGIINRKGEWILEPKYTDLTNFDYGLAYAKYNGKYGFIDNLGNWVIKPKYDYTFPFVDANKKNCVDCLNRVKIFPELVKFHFNHDDEE